MNDQDRSFRVSVPADDADAFVDACRAAAWRALDTGERIMTDDGPDAEAVLTVVPRRWVEKEERPALPATMR